MTSKKLNMDAAVSAGAGLKSPIEDRFIRAQSVIASQPTGFSASTTPAVMPPPQSVSGDSPYFAEIDVSMLDENPFNARRIYRQERIESLSESIKQNGQDTPVMVTMRGGRYTLAAGHYRRKAIILAGIGKIKAMVHPEMSDQDLYLMSHRENDERSEQTALDNALVWRDVINSKLYATEAALAEALNKSAPTVNKTLAILSLPESVIAVVSEAPELFSLTSLYELTLLAKVTDDETVMKRMAEKIRDGEAGRNEVKSLRESLAEKKQSTPRTRQGNSRQYKIEFDGTKAGYIKDFDHGKVVFEVNGLTPEMRVELVNLLKEKFKVV